MEIKRISSQPASKGPSEYFTGTVRIDPLFQANAPAREEIRPGDVIWFPPGEKHWHGAAPTTAMTHIAIQEQLDGKTVDWMEKGQRRTIPGLIECAWNRREGVNR
jgi:hypothetical protein